MSIKAPDRRCRRLANRSMNGAGEKIRPVALEERLVSKVQTSDRTRLANNSSGLEPRKDLLRAVLGPFGHEADVFKHASAGFRNPIAV